MVRVMKGGRALLVLVAVMAIALAACGSSSGGGKTSAPSSGGGGQATPTSGGGGGEATPTSGGGGGGLAEGLASNLDNLDSYQFSTTILAGESTASAEGLTVTGTAVNKPTKSLLLNNSGIYFLVIGDQGWTSLDGQTWMVSPDTTYDSLADLLPGNLYVEDFNGLVTDFQAAGDEQKNGVACTHYHGDESALVAVYGAASQAQADLWVAKDGNYPVSGSFSFEGSAAGLTGFFGYSFNVTHINDSAANTLPTP
jgi:hypothetical protein